MDKIPESEWEWDGYKMHYCCADECQFGMSTKVGVWIVSTVGHMVSDDLYMEKNPDGIKMEKIGRDRFFETMVFRAGKANCDCCDWRPVIESQRGVPLNWVYKTAREARDGHVSICEYISKNQSCELVDEK